MDSTELMQHLTAQQQTLSSQADNIKTSMAPPATTPPVHTSQASSGTVLRTFTTTTPSGELLHTQLKQEQMSRTAAAVSVSRTPPHVAMPMLSQQLSAAVAPASSAAATLLLTKPPHTDTRTMTRTAVAGAATGAQLPVNTNQQLKAKVSCVHLIGNGPDLGNTFTCF